MADEQPMYPPMEFELPSASKKCAQCGTKRGGSRIFHKRGFLEGTCGRTLGYPAIETLGPHMDRKCFECQNEWCEQVSPFGFDDDEDED